MTMKECIVPFEGFYSSTYEDMIDDYLIRECLDRDLSDKDSEAFINSIDFVKVRNQISRDYVSLLNDLINDETGLDIKLSYIRMESPREYNFTTDKILCSVSLADIEKIFNKIDRNILNKVIKARHT